MKLECEISVKHIIFIFPNFELRLTAVPSFCCHRRNPESTGFEVAPGKKTLWFLTASIC